MGEKEEEIGKVARQAKLKLSEGEARKLAGEIQEILRMFDEMDDERVDGLEPTVHPAKAGERLRDDEVVETRWDPFCCSRLVQDRQFVGPRLVDTV